MCSSVVAVIRRMRWIRTRLRLFGHRSGYRDGRQILEYQRREMAPKSSVLRKAASGSAANVIGNTHEDGFHVVARACSDIFRVAARAM